MMGMDDGNAGGESDTGSAGDCGGGGSTICDCCVSGHGGSVTIIQYDQLYTL